MTGSVFYAAVQAGRVAAPPALVVESVGFTQWWWQVNAEDAPAGHRAVRGLDPLGRTVESQRDSHQ
jgi:hypothetical protein